MSEANRGRGQPRRGYRRTKPATRSGAGRLWSRRAAGFLLHTFLSPPKEKCERPIGLQALPSRRSRRVIPRHGELLTATLLPMMQAGWLSARPPAPPSDRHPKQSSAPWDGQSQSAPESARQPNRGRGVCACGRTKGLSSGQTIGAARTAVRSACCLPELRVANRLRRLYPLDTRFPSFPFGNLRIANRSNRAPHRAASHAHTPESARQSPPGGISCGKVVY